MLFIVVDVFQFVIFLYSEQIFDDFLNDYGYAMLKDERKASYLYCIVLFCIFYALKCATLF